MDGGRSGSMKSMGLSLRRSGVRLRSLGSNHGDLMIVLAQLKNVRSAAKELIKAQEAAAEDLAKWASNERSRAIVDVFKHVAEFAQLFAEIQRENAENLKEFRRHFEKILEGARHVDEVKEKFEAAEAKETKLRKELKKKKKPKKEFKNGFSDDDLSEVRELKGKLETAERERESERMKLDEMIQEDEVVKMILIKKGLLKFSESVVETAQKTEILFTAQRKIAAGLPDIEANIHSISQIRYDGAPSALQTVLETKERLKNFRRGEYVQQQLQPPPYIANPPPENPFYVDPATAPPPSDPYRRHSSSLF